ncbi:MAG: alcohol dehydrogenase catalytic domain-containing protein [Clostridia bacterium]|nr:alcohol dehydrogenase catalytic domain-containing protein [Clostridia bacterium]
MRGLYGRRGFEVALRERGDVEVTGRKVRLRVAACGVCGTDLHFLRELNDFTPMGHEISAVVEEVGPEVTRVKPGDRVICEDVSPCGSCPACKSGQSRLCRSGYNLEGQPGMSDTMVVHENLLNPFEGIDPVTASMVEPLAVAIRGVRKLNLRPLGSLAVFGMGAIGLLSAAYARAMGAGRIAMVARRRGSLRNRAAEDAALAFGADEIYYSGDGEGYTADMIRAGAFDAAIVAAPPAVCEDAMRVVGYGGSVLAQGVTFGGNPMATLNVSEMVFEKKQLLTSLAEPAENFPLSIELIRTGRVDAGRIITHRLPMSRANELGRLYGQDAPAIKTVILPGE